MREDDSRFKRSRARYNGDDSSRKHKRLRSSPQSSKEELRRDIARLQVKKAAGAKALRVLHAHYDKLQTELESSEHSLQKLTDDLAALESHHNMKLIAAIECT